jgi:hypothetical protein
VTVNRLWMQVMGRGLVKTAEDFGSQGERPYHAALLEHLSARFIKSGYDVKALMKAILMSQVYRQGSLASAQVMADDPDNQWLARGPRHRLSAEMIRDNALAASGLLKLAMGGPPVNAYEMTEAFKPTSISGGTDVYRRSLYSAWRRTSPPPAMTTFDAPKRSVCTAKRDRTDSPLQALILLNGTQYVEAARALGQALHLEHQGKLEQMVRGGFLRCLSREPDAKEMNVATALYQEQLQWFQANAAEAAELLKQGRAAVDPSLSQAQAAAATVLGQLLLNHDACVVKR